MGSHRGIEPYGVAVGHSMDARVLLERGRTVPFVIAHRGASGYAPENTCAAYRAAIDLGVVAVETDVHLTKDGVIVTIHDSTFDRTTTGRGKVCDVSFEAASQFDAGSWYSDAFSAETIPSLDQYLKVLDKRAIPVIEIKGGEGIEHQLAARFEQKPHAAFFFSFDAVKIRTLKRLCPHAPCLYLLPWTEAVIPCDPAHIDEAVSMCMDAVGVHWERMSPALVGRAHDAGLSVFVYTVNTRKGAAQCMQYGVDAVISDVPDRVREWIGEYDVHE